MGFGGGRGVNKQAPIFAMLCTLKHYLRVTDPELDKNAAVLSPELPKATLSQPYNNQLSAHAACSWRDLEYRKRLFDLTNQFPIQQLVAFLVDKK